MANWSNPTLTSLYTDFLLELKARDTDLALQFDGTTSTNLETGTIRWSSSANRWQKWNGTSWAELTTTYALTGLSTTGNASIGGTLSVTGATTLAAATATTPATNDNSTAVATTAYVRAQAYAPLASPALTGTPTAPTAAVSTNTTQLATTAFVLGQISNDALLKTGGTLTGALQTIAGTVTAPGVGIGEANTGLFRPSAGVLGFAVGGSESLRLNAAGGLGLGSTGTNANVGFRHAKSITGGTTAWAQLVDGAVQTDVTSVAAGIASNVGTAASTTLTSLVHFQASTGTLGAGTTITNQIGFSATSTMDGATNDFGFYGNIGAGSGNWNCYMVGAAANYFAGQVQLGAGSVGTPSLSTNGDTNTGIYFPAADTIGFVEGGVEAMRLDSSGRLGIGITSPGANLELGSAASANQSLKINSAGNNYLELSTTGATGEHKITAGNSASGTAQLIFETASGGVESERARIDSSGRLLVGTSTSRLSRIYYPGGDGASNPGSQLEATSTGSTFQIVSNQAGAVGSAIVLGKSRGTATGSIVAVQNGDQLGTIQFNGIDVTTTGDLESCAGSIACEVDGTPGANDMPGRLVFSTTADGASSPTERLRITSAGLVGIGTTAPGTNFHVVTGTNAGITVNQTLATGSWSAGDYTQIGLGVNNQDTVQIRAIQAASSASSYASDIAFINRTANTMSEKARIDSSGRLLVGATTSKNIGAQFKLQVEATDATAGYSVLRHGGTAAGAGPNIRLARSRGTTLDSVTAVANGDSLGGIAWHGANGIDYINIAGRIDCEVDGEPSTSGDTTDLPGRLVFSTTADGASSPTERLRITSTGQVRLATAGITFNGDTATANELDDYEEGTWTPAFSFSTSGSVTYTTQDGIYTKIGNTVIARASLVLTGVSSPTGNASITGLPFTVSSRVGSGTIGIARNFASAGLPLSVYASNSSTSILIMKNATNAGTSQLQGSDLTATTNFYLTVIYSV